ncbi:unnamed protein product [Mytilus coruscus]|uniref:Uncharacterized protein n=1 Tax=Mytilus coruscus TaxID=42192 RepID=A0A6J8C951_MYTCO|nr:unnamed protein product [Mytilus coruscus]
MYRGTMQVECKLRQKGCPGNDKYEGFIPFSIGERTILQSTPNVNCIFNAISIILYEDETMAMMLKLAAVVKMVDELVPFTKYVILFCKWFQLWKSTKEIFTFGNLCNYGVIGPTIDGNDIENVIRMEIIETIKTTIHGLNQATSGKKTYAQHGYGPSAVKTLTQATTCRSCYNSQNIMVNEISLFSRCLKDRGALPRDQNHNSREQMAEATVMMNSDSEHVEEPRDDSSGAWTAIVVKSIFLSRKEEKADTKFGPATFFIYHADQEITDEPSGSCQHKRLSVMEISQETMKARIEVLEFINRVGNTSRKKEDLVLGSRVEVSQGNG